MGDHRRRRVAAVRVDPWSPRRWRPAPRARWRRRAPTGAWVSMPRNSGPSKPARRRYRQTAWVIAWMCASLNPHAKAEPRWPEVPKVTRCEATVGSGGEGEIGGHQAGHVDQQRGRDRLAGQGAYAFSHVVPPSAETDPHRVRSAVVHQLGRPPRLRRSRSACRRGLRVRTPRQTPLGFSTVIIVGRGPMAEADLEPAATRGECRGRGPASRPGRGSPAAAPALPGTSSRPSPCTRSSPRGPTWGATE